MMMGSCLWPGFVNLQGDGLRISHLGPGGRVRAQSSYEIVKVLCRLIPVDLAILLKDFGCFLGRLLIADQSALRSGFVCAVSYGLCSFNHQVGTHHHEPVMKGAGI